MTARRHAVRTLERIAKQNVDRSRTGSPILESLRRIESWNDTPSTFHAATAVLDTLREIEEGEVKRHQERLSEFIRSENGRLDRLIMNLYTLFTLEPRHEQNVFESACHGIAEYFHAGDCSILLTRHEADDDRVRTSLQLMGAFGAWERALSSPFVRRWQPIRYEVPGPSQELGNTPYFWLSEEPVRRAHRGQFITGKDRPISRSTAEAAYSQVWINNHLGTTCRNILGISFRRPDAARGHHAMFGEGVLKIENRRPREITAFNEGSDAELYLAEYWAVTSLRPYLRYLKEHAPESHHKVNEVGWRRLYEQLAPEAALFETVRNGWYKLRCAAQDRKDKASVAKATNALGALIRQLDELLRFVTLAETFLQHVHEALKSLVKGAESGGPDLAFARNIPSLFNTVNLSNAWRRSALVADVSADQEKMLRAIADALGIYIDLRTVGAPQSPDGNQTVQRAMDRVRRDLLDRVFTHKGASAVGDHVAEAVLAAFRGELRQLDFDCQAGYLHLGLWLKTLSERLVAFGRDALGRLASADARAPLHVEEECRRARRAALEVSEILRDGWDRSGLVPDPSASAYNDPPRESTDPVENAVADALASAAMFAHTFAPVDEARILFVSRRVWQLLANRVIALAHRKGIHITHEQVRRLHLDDFAVEALEHIHVQTQAIGVCLERVVTWWSGAEAIEEKAVTLPRVETTLLNKHFLKQVASQALDAADPRVGERKVVLLSVTCRDVIPALPRFRKQFSEPDSQRRDWTVELALEPHGAKTRTDGGALFELCVRLPRAPADLEHSHWLWAVSRSLDGLHRELSSWLDGMERARRAPGETNSVSRRRIQTTFHTPPPLRSTGASESRQWASQKGVSAGPLDQMRRALDDAILAVEGAQGDDLFEQIEVPLHKLCETIAQLIEADSCAVFFLDEPIANAQMRMRGAYGPVQRTFAQSGDTRQRHPGLSYRSLWESVPPEKCVDRKTLEEFILGDAGRDTSPGVWPLTNQIWHLGEGRIAYSREQFRKMRAGKGLGDQFAYPPDGAAHAAPETWTLKNVFRSFIGIPIFSRGGQTDYVMNPNDRSLDDANVLRSEFHSQHRVVGMLKLEGKHPNFKLIDDTWWDSLSDSTREKVLSVLGGESRDKRKAVDALEELYASDGLKPGDHRGFALLAIRKGQDGAMYEVDGALVDELTRALDARWQPENVELLVAIAMEIGRLLTLHTLKIAVDQEVFLGESDVGILGIRPDDVGPIVAAKSVAEKVCRKVQFELRRVQDELEKERSDALRDKPASAELMHKPIRHVEVRPKKDASLFAKLVEKEAKRSQGRSQEAKPGDVAADGQTSDSHKGLEGQLRIGHAVLDLPHHGFPARVQRVRGQVEMQVCRRDDGSYAIEHLAGDMYVGEHRARWNEATGGDSSAGSGFLSRLFSRRHYALDDWAGVRVECGFLSDLDLVLDAIRARFPDCGLSVCPDLISSWLDCPQPSGYRAIHATILVPIARLASQSEMKSLTRFLPIDPVTLQHAFPCELQIRTDYQASWAKASKDIQHKNPHVQRDLRQYMRSLSGLLYEADQIMEVVLENIESKDLREQELLQELRRKLRDGDFALVQFAAHAARQIHRDHRLYGGLPHFSRLVDVNHRLVHWFNVDDPYFLVLAFFQDLWLHEDAHSGGVTIQSRLRQKLKQCIRTDRSGLVDRLARRLPVDAHRHRRARPVEDSFFDLRFDCFAAAAPHWFWDLLEVCRQVSAEDHGPQVRGFHVDQRLKLLDEKYGPQPKDLRGHKYTNPGTNPRAAQSSPRPPIDSNVLRVGCVLETASLLSRLQELPGEPLRHRAIEELGMIYRTLQKIRGLIGSEVRFVLQRAEHELHRTATKLETPLPIDWDF